LNQINLSGNEYHKAANIIVSAILGASGEELDNIEEDGEECFDVLMQKLKAIKKLPEDFLSVIESLQSIQNLRERYLPPYLTELVGGWGKALKSAALECAPRFWRLFTEVNSAKFTQHLYPQPKNSARYASTVIFCRYFGITTTMLAGIFTSYMQQHPDLELPGLPAGCLTKKGKIGISDTIWTNKPDVLWKAILPKVGAKSNFLHFMQYDGYCMKIEIAKTNSQTASSHPSGFNSRSWRTYRDENEEVFNSITV
jgi:hypothetical protein